MLNSILLNASAAVYMFSAAAFLVFIVRQNKTALRAGLWLFGLAFIMQSLTLVLEAFSFGQLPIFNLRGAVGFFGWALALAFLILSARFRFPALGAFVSPLVAAVVFLSVLLPAGSARISPLPLEFWLTTHLISVFLGYGFFALSFVAGVMYLLQEHQIKSKRTGSLHKRLPSLNVLDSLNFYCLTLGFPFITLGLISGSVYASITLGSFWQWDSKEIWAAITWLIYAALLHQRLTVGWRGRRAALLSIIGFSVLCFTFLGISHFSPSYHSFKNLERLQMK